MSNAEVRRILMIDPFSQDTAVLQAIAHDAQIAALAHELQQQQLQLDDAMQVPVPPMLAEHLLKLPHQQRKSPRWFSLVALAASVALISVISVGTWQSSYAKDLGGHALAHVYHEADYLQAHASQQPLNEVNLKLASFGAQLTDWQDEIIYARYCTFQGVRSLHLAVRTADGYATVFVVPKQAELTMVSEFADTRYQGLTLPMSGANVLIVSENKSDLSTLPEKLASKLIFSA